MQARVNADTKITGIAEIMQAPPKITTHVVAKGETVYSIANTCNTTVQAIYRLNPDAEKGIKTGEKLKIQAVRKATGYSNHRDRKSVV
jgi:LysM repeat protein